MGNITSMEVTLDDFNFDCLTPSHEQPGRKDALARMKERGKAEFFLQSLHEVPAQLFSGFENLTSITLSVNRIKVICPPLCRITTLTVLNLAFNDIQALPREIGNLTNLVMLNLKHNCLNSLPAEINNLVELQHLNLEYNRFRTLPKLDRLKKLTEFRAAHNNLRSIEAFPGYMKQVLDMQSNELGDMFARVAFTEASVADLRDVFLLNNGLTQFNDSFRFLTNMVRLDIQNNLMTELNNTTVHSWAALAELNLRQNNLTAFPPNFCELPCLKKMNVCSNQLRALPAEFWKLTTLSLLNLGGNFLTELPTKNLDGMKSLTDICLANNQFTELPVGLCSLPTLKVINLAWNKLTAIPNEIQQMSRLSWLVLNGNNITELPDIMSNLKWMKEMYLGANKLTKLPDGFAEMKGLEWLDIRLNDIATVPVGLQRLIFLEHIDAGDNASFKVPDFLRDKEKKGLVVRCDTGSIENGRWHVGCADMKGKRGTMEDASVVHVKYRGKKNEDLFGVYDGHGGSEAAQICGKRHPKILKEQLKRCDAQMDDDDVVDAIRSSFIQCSDGLKKNEVKNSGTTAVVCFCSGTRIFVADVGDSRAVLYRGGKAKRISMDHKPDLPEEERRIRMQGGFVAANGRVVGKLAVSRAFGDLELRPFVSPEPFIDVIDISKKVPEFLILACDGVWDVISDEKACSIVLSEIDHPQRAAMKLRDCAYAYGSLDNISVIVVVW
eukprot:TRINITY_DN5030_c0_g1_i1.p1 TRINITY_DN5030_c0_g1~~TRINITY_DN5030_c0_g1_i1.p1  ORF type:complete len:723 (+),score=113.59 TRINITY_DN5030_c0_g1_i1:2554-4722(+)